MNDGDCTPPLRRCDTTEAADRCVQCLVNADCAAPFVCATAMKVCVECTPADQSACRADVAGARCVAGGSCGCAMDVDCGGVTSGRVCDPATARCVPGCRQTGGNGCPSSLSCTSAGTEIGACQPMPGADGGADGSTGDGSTGDGSIGDGSGADGAMDASADVPGAGGDAAGDAPGADGAAGTDGRADAGIDGAGVNANLGGYVAGGGCQCNAPGSSPAGAALLILAGVLAFARRRRR